VGGIRRGCRGVRPAGLISFFVCGGAVGSHVICLSSGTNDKSATNWILFGFKPNTETLEVVETSVGLS
jgi:hypothetical protein